MCGGVQSPGETHGCRSRHSVCLAAHASGGFKSHSTRGPGLISNGGGSASPAGERGRDGAPDTGTNAKAGHRQGEPAAPSGGTPEGRAPTARGGLQGLRRTPGSSSRGGPPPDAPVGPRGGMVAPARWRQRRLGSSPAPQGVCGRHGGEDAWVPQGGLVSSKWKVWSRSCDTRRRKGGPIGNPNVDLEPPGGRGGDKRERRARRGEARSRSEE